MLCDEALYRKHRNEPTENLRFDNGPWLKPSIVAAERAVLQAERVGEGRDGRYEFADIRIRNTSAIPAFPVTVDVADDQKRFFLSDNFFLLKAGEAKTVRVTCDRGAVESVRIGLWNGDSVVV